MDSKISLFRLFSGAGNHSSSLSQEYAKVCKAACKVGAKALAEGKSALDAATEAVVILEDSPLSNAALGSSLTWDGNVECDAGVMEGTNKHWGAVGAVSGVKNPCRLAREICVQQSRVDGLGRIQPCLLVGPGAVSWAIKNSVPTLDPESLVHALAKNKFETYKRRILTLQEYNSKKAMEQLDTVGAVCIDGLGRTAAVCSSGGIALKESGRVGQAAMFGAGCWAENCTEDKLAVAACTTGCGEHLMRCSLAQRIATAIREQPPGNISASVFNTVIQSHFLDSPMLTGVEERLCGAIALTCNPKDGFGEFLWAHSTKTFILGHMEVHSKPKLIISSLPLGQSPGKGLVGGGSQFILPAVAQVDSMESSVLDYTVTLVKEMDPMCSQNSHLI